MHNVTLKLYWIYARARAAIQAKGHIQYCLVGSIDLPRPLHRQTTLTNVAQQAILDNVAQQPTLLLKPQDMSSCGFKSNDTYQTTLTNVACQATLVNIVQRWNGLGKSMLPTRQYWMCPFAWIAALAQAIFSNITQPKWDTLLGYNALITPPQNRVRREH